MGMIEIGVLKPSAGITVVEAEPAYLDSCVLTDCIAEDSFFHARLGTPVTLCGTFAPVNDPTFSVTTEVLTADNR